MYHWYKLARPRKSTKISKAASDSIIDGGGSHDDDEEDDSDWTAKEKRLFLWLGLIETLPLISGGVIACFLDGIPCALAGGLGLLGTVVLCWLFRNKIPPTRVEIAAELKSG